MYALLNIFFFYLRTNKVSLPSFDPNLELVKLFVNDILCRPKNFETFKGKTKKAYDELWRYQKRECELTVTSYQPVLKLLTEVEDALVQIKLQYIRLVDKRLERRDKSLHDYKLYVSMIHCKGDSLE